MGKKISILPDAPYCPECQTRMVLETVQDPVMLEYISAWECPECGYLERAAEDDQPPSATKRVVRGLRRYF